MTTSEAGAAELVELALSAGDDPPSWRPFLQRLVERPTPEVLAACRPLLVAADPRRRSLGALALALVARDRSLHDEVRSAALDGLDPAAPVLALDTLLDVLRHVGAGELAAPALRDHPEAVVRSAVARALYGADSPAAVDTLVALVADHDPGVRADAAFALGSQVDVDTDAVRDALVAALDDEDEDVRREAAIGLGRRGDRRALPELFVVLGEDDAPIGALEAAAAVAEPSLAPALHQLRRRAPARHWWLRERALLACSPARWN